jgi:O-antigen ligase
MASGLVWVAVAGLLAAAEAVATVLDLRTGVALAIAAMVAYAVVARPPLLLPIAIVTVSLESLVFVGQPITRLFVLGALMLVLLELMRGGARIRLAPPLAMVVVYLVWTVASGLWSVDLGGTRFQIQSLVIALVFMLAFAALLNSERDLRLVLYVLGFASALTGGLSVIAFGSTLTLPGIDLLQGGRSQGGVGDPDFFAAMQLASVPAVLVAASDAKQKWLRLGLYAAVLTMLAAVFTSLSRGGFLATIVLGIVFLCSRPERLFRSGHEKAIAVAVIALGCVAFFSRPYVRGEVVSRAESIYAPQNKDDKSGSGRTNLWKAAAKTAKEHPLQGIGYGSFGAISQELLFATPGVDLDVQQIREEGHYFVAHNTYLGTSAELGLTGLMIYLGLIIATGMALRRSSVRAEELGAPFVGRVAHAFMLGLISWAVTDFFLSGETARMFWVIVGLALALPKLLPEPQQATLSSDVYAPRSNAPTS